MCILANIFFLVYLFINKLQDYKYQAKSAPPALSGWHLYYRVLFTPVKVLLHLSFLCSWEDSLIHKEESTRVSKLDKIMKKYVHVTNTLIICKSYTEKKINSYLTNRVNIFMLKLSILHYYFFKNKKLFKSEKKIS